MHVLPRPTSLLEIEDLSLTEQWFKNIIHLHGKCSGVLHRLVMSKSGQYYHVALISPQIIENRKL